MKKFAPRYPEDRITVGRLLFQILTDLSYSFALSLKFVDEINTSIERYDSDLHIITGRSMRIAGILLLINKRQTPDQINETLNLDASLHPSRDTRLVQSDFFSRCIGQRTHAALARGNGKNSEQLLRELLNDALECICEVSEIEMGTAHRRHLPLDPTTCERAHEMLMSLPHEHILLVNNLLHRFYQEDQVRANPLPYLHLIAETFNSAEPVSEERKTLSNASV